MQRRTAASRLRRLLAMIPWLAGQDGPTVTEVCERFGNSRADLEADLELLLYVGVPPYTPDQLFEIGIEGDRVFAHLTPTLDRPPRLTPEEGLALVVAGAALAAVPGAEPGGPLARAIDKVAALLGIDADEAIDVDLGPAAPATLTLLREAVAGRRRVELDYYASGRDEHSRRTVDPWHVVHEGGAWYLLAGDHLRGERRSFRVDRVLSARLLDEEATPPPPGEGSTVGFAPGDEVPRVVLELPASAAWVADAYPVDAADVVDDERIRVTLPVAGRACSSVSSSRSGRKRA